MTVIVEGNLEFTFGPTWRVLKYDQNGAFYKSQFESRVKPTKAVDFLCLNSGPTLLMLEAKDFSLGVPKQEKFDHVPLAVALKARDTIAGIIGGSYQASSPVERSFFQDAYRKMANPPRVFYLFEDLATPTRREPKYSANKRDVLLKQLRERLRWLTREVAVIGLNDYPQFISDLIIRRV